MHIEIYGNTDSASGNLKDVRDNEFQAVLPVRGKILNTEKATLKQIVANAEIMSMFDAFGVKLIPISIDKGQYQIVYDKSKDRYGKIIIMSDADVNNTAYERLFA